VFVIVSWPVALAVLLTLWTARLTVATLHLTWRVTLFLCRLLGMFVVWAVQYFSDGHNKLIRVDFNGVRR
jgi:hypothetical protein